jgi:polysaccharide export outer membrane protein
MERLAEKTGFGKNAVIHRRAALALVLGTGLLVTGCMPESDLASLPSSDDTNYRLGVGDQIRVITYNETQLTNTFTVGDDGTIAFPLVGSVKAEGKTSRGLAAAISAQLIAKDLMESPSVSVQVTQYRPISVLGEVNHPGQYPYQPGMTMLDAVALAGGFTYRAVTSYATDVRTLGSNGGQVVKGKIRNDSRLEPGDVVTILERYF